MDSQISSELLAQSTTPHYATSQDTVVLNFTVILSVSPIYVYTYLCFLL